MSLYNLTVVKYWMIICSHIFMANGILMDFLYQTISNWGIAQNPCAPFMLYMDFYCSTQLIEHCNEQLK